MSPRRVREDPVERMARDRMQRAPRAEVTGSEDDYLGFDIFNPPPPGAFTATGGTHRTAHTSASAARRVAPKAPTMRERLAALLVAVGPRGMTRKELMVASGIIRDTVNARVVELLRARTPDRCALFIEWGTRDHEKVIIATRFAEWVLPFPEAVEATEPPPQPSEATDGRQE